MLVRVIPINFVIMGICMLITPVMIRFMSLNFCATIATNFCFEYITVIHYGCFNFSGSSQIACILRFVWIGSPLTPVSTSSALANHIWCQYITINRCCATYFISVQILFRQTAFIAHITPRASVVVYIHNIPVHFGERCVVADDPFWLDLAKHFIVACHEPFFLVLAVIVFGCHVG